MTENEAIEILDGKTREQALYQYEANDRPYVIAQAEYIAIKALQEIKQYRELGTIDEIKEILQIISEGQDDIDESGISTGLLRTLLEYAKYEKFGTVEECKKSADVRKQVTEIINRELIAGEDTYEEVYSCFWEIVKVIQDNY